MSLGSWRELPVSVSFSNIHFLFIALDGPLNMIFGSINATITLDHPVTTQATQPNVAEWVICIFAQCLKYHHMWGLNSMASVHIATYIKYFLCFCRFSIEMHSVTITGVNNFASMGSKTVITNGLATSYVRVKSPKVTLDTGHTRSRGPWPTI